MSKVVTEIQVNSFNKGFISEASPLTFPKDASLQEENFTLNLNGSRTRRLGIDYESLYALNNITSPNYPIEDSRVDTYLWQSPSEANLFSFSIIRINEQIYFLDATKGNPSGSILFGGLPITIPEIGNKEIGVSSLKGQFIITCSSLKNPVAISFNQVENNIYFSYINLRIRDFFGIQEVIGNTVRPNSTQTTPNVVYTHHFYNLENQGWNDKIQFTGYVAPTEETINNSIEDSEYIPFVSIQKTSSLQSALAIARSNRRRRKEAGFKNAIARTAEVTGNYPSNADIWTYGKIGVANNTDVYDLYDPNVMKKNSIYDIPAPKGAIILNAFERGASRAAVTDLTGLPEDRDASYCTCSAAFAGRAFYSGITANITGRDNNSPDYSSYIFFSQVVENNLQLGKCYQENDPTNPDLNDLLDSDGGTIHILGIKTIISMLAIRDSLLVFASNGIWEITGDGAPFSATNFKISKITNIGVINKGSIIEQEGNIFYWSVTGIHVITQDPQTSRFQEQNLSLTTINKFYSAIPIKGKINSIGVYSAKLGEVKWLYNDLVQTNPRNVFTYTKELILNLKLQAFSVNTFNTYTDKDITLVDGTVILDSNYTDLATTEDYTEFGIFTVAGVQIVTVGNNSISTVSNYNPIISGYIKTEPSSIVSNQNITTVAGDGVTTAGGFGTKFANPSILPTGEAWNSKFSPSGAIIAVAHDISSFVSAYTWSDTTGFGTKFANPSVLPTGTGRGISFSPSGARIVVAHAVSPHLSAYTWSDTTGFGTKFTDPSILPASLGTGVSFSPSGVSVIISHNNSPYLSAYTWSDTTGFGTKFANPSILPTGNGRSVSFSPSGASIAVAYETSPFISAYTWSDTTGFGTKFTDPSILPESSGLGVSFSPTGTSIAVAHVTSPFVSAYTWSDTTGFGTKFTDPSILPASSGLGVSFSPTGTSIAVAHVTSPFVSAYTWSDTTGFGTKFANPSVLPTGTGRGISFSPSGASIAVAHATSPFVSVYPWVDGGILISANIESGLYQEESIKYLTLKKNTAASGTLNGYSFTLSGLTDKDFVDWETTGFPLNYKSIILTGYEIAGDILRKKQVPYIHFYFNKTETLNANNVEINKSSCMVQSQWNWTNNTASGKWGEPFQAYRKVQDLGSNLASNGEGVVFTKSKLRGFGRSLSLKITSQKGKDMQLLGWAFPITGNSKG